MRWQDRTILIDGHSEFSFKFDENNDEFVTSVKGFNRMRILKKDKTYRSFDFSLPEGVSFKNIVDDEYKQRSITVDGFMYMRGEMLSAIVAFNYFKSTMMFNAFYGLVNQKIVNYPEVHNGHAFIGLVFHNSGFSLNEFDNGEIFDGYFSKMKNDDGTSAVDLNAANRYVGVSNQGVVEQKELDKKEKEKIDKNKSNFNMVSGGKKPKAYYSRRQLERLAKIEDDKKNKKERCKKNKQPRMNINPWYSDTKIFIKLCQFLSRITKKNNFITCFADSFIFKIFIGSIVYLNFFEINHNVTQKHTLVGYYLHFNNKIVQRPVSYYNKEKEIMIIFDDYRFFRKPKRLFEEDLWKVATNPLTTDTRYREDLLWLLRYHQLMMVDLGFNKEENAENVEKTAKQKAEEFEAKDELERKRSEACVNAGRWKEVLELYTTFNISVKLNKKTERQLLKEERERKEKKEKERLRRLAEKEANEQALKKKEAGREANKQKVEIK